MSKISIVDLEVHFHIGVPRQERVRAQRLLLSVDMIHDFAPAAAADRVSKTIDYFKVAQRLLRLGDGRSWKLIEKLATDVADLVLREFCAASVTVTVSLTKPRPTAGKLKGSSSESP